MKKLFIILPFFSILTLRSMEWKVSQIAPTVYYHGMGSTQLQLLRYCPKFKTTTGEIASRLNAINIVHTPWVAPEIDEVILQPQRISWAQMFNPLQWGVLAYFQATNYINQWNRYKIEPTDGSETIRGHAINIRKINVGQDGDMANHKKKWDACMQKYPDKPKILFGASRGGATTFSAHAQHHYPNVKLVILEGCFDTVEHVLQKRLPKPLQNTGLHKWATWILEKCTSFKQNGPSPLSSVKTFPHDVPVVFITSLKDWEVSMDCTKNLVATLAQERAKHSDAQPVYLLVLKHSSHPSYSTQHEEDKRTYQTFMHTLYKHYNLPYIEAFVDPNLNLKEFQFIATS